MAAAELLSVASSGAEDESKSLAPLAKLWESDPTIRQIVLQNKALLVWPTKQKTGVITFETMAMNCKVLEKVLDVWCPRVPTAKTVAIEPVRDEACMSKTMQWSNNFFQVKSRFCSILNSYLAQTEFKVLTGWGFPCFPFWGTPRCRWLTFAVSYLWGRIMWRLIVMQYQSGALSPTWCIAMTVAFAEIFSPFSSSVSLFMFGFGTNQKSQPENL